MRASLELPLGDIILIVNAENISSPRGYSLEMAMFNDLINFWGWIDFPFNGHSYTWSNMQDPPLLLKLDWVFCSTEWLACFPKQHCSTSLKTGI